MIESENMGNIVDPRLQEEFYTSFVQKVMEIVMSCIPSIAIKRVNMSQVSLQLILDS